MSLGAVCSAPVTAQVPFGDRQYPMGGSPYAVALADLDRDGRLDAITADNFPGTGSVTVARGDGRGGFGAPTRTVLSSPPEHLALGDFDNDGRVDVVATHDTGTGVSVLLGDGAGGWRSVTPFATGGRSISVAVTDLDLDGNLDIVAGTQFALSDGGLAVLLGNGAGGFAPARTFVLSNSFPPALAIGQFDADPRPDVVAVSFTHRSVYFGDSAALLRAPLHLPGATSGFAPAVADFDEDRNADIVIGGGSNGLGELAIYPGNGAGGFGTARLIPTSATAYVVTARDLDGDAHVDVVVGDRSGGTSYLRGDGRGNLTSTLQLPRVWTLEGLAIGDLDGNGALDLVASSRNNNSIAPFLATAPGRFDTLFSPFANGSPVGGVVLLDADRDGALDVLASSQIGLHTFRGNGTGSFALTSSLLGDTGGALTACNLDGDGHADLAALQSAAVLVWRGDGQGGWNRGGTFPVSQGARGLALGDLDGDGRTDAVTVSALTVFPQIVSRLDILRGDGAGRFGAALARTVPHPVMGVALADLDRDGSLDVLTVHAAPSSALLVFRNDGAGNFGAPTSFALPTTAYAAAVGDLDGDGDLDAALAGEFTFGGGTLLVLDGDGRGGFAAARSIPLPSRAFGIALRDCDGDGRLDAVVTAGNLQTLLLLGLGNGNFQAPLAFTTGGVPTLGDVDANGRLDLVTFDQGVLVALNRLAVPVGVATFGVGTPGCQGIHGTSTTGVPRIGSADFGVVTTNLPARAFGVHYLAVGADVPGSLLLGIRFHFDFLQPFLSWTSPGVATETGTAVAPLPIPPGVHLVGATVVVQSTWVLPATSPCRPSPLGVSSGRGVRLTLQN